MADPIDEKLHKRLIAFLDRSEQEYRDRVTKSAVRHLVAYTVVCAMTAALSALSPHALSLIRPAASASAGLASAIVAWSLGVGSAFLLIVEYFTEFAVTALEVVCPAICATTLVVFAVAATDFSPAVGGGLCLTTLALAQYLVVLEEIPRASLLPALPGTVWSPGSSWRARGLAMIQINEWLVDHMFRIFGMALGFGAFGCGVWYVARHGGVDTPAFLGFLAFTASPSATLATVALFVRRPDSGHTGTAC